MTKVVGTDLGTTNSCVAVMEGKPAKVIEKGITSGGERLAAKHQAIANPGSTFHAIKRLIGDGPSVQKRKTLLAYKIVGADDGDAGVGAHGRIYSLAQVAALVTAESSVGAQVSEAVITAPAYFNDTQRQAGKTAGLDVLRIINEPTAAALACKFDKKDGKAIALYDLGGGAFDVSVLEIGGGVFEVKSANGDAFLGGEDLDGSLVECVAACFCAESGVDVRLDKLALQRVRDAAERAKTELSSALTTEGNLPFITADSAGPKRLADVITTARSSEPVDERTQKAVSSCELALADTNLCAERIDEVVLVGGATRMTQNSGDCGTVV